MFILSEIFVRTGITVDEYYAKPPKVRAFMFASMVAKLEREQEQRKREVCPWLRPSG